MNATKATTQAAVYAYRYQTIILRVHAVVTDSPHAADAAMMDTSMWTMYAMPRVMFQLHVELAIRGTVCPASMLVAEEEAADRAQQVGIGTGESVSMLGLNVHLNYQYGTATHAKCQP
jgi:hypothetical protein